MHHFNEGSLLGCYRSLEGNKSVGADKISKAQYGIELDKNIKDLISRMKRLQYHPAAVKQVLIAKENKAGATRPLGISNFEDKIVQKMSTRSNIRTNVLEMLLWFQGRKRLSSCC